MWIGSSVTDWNCSVIFDVATNHSEHTNYCVRKGRAVFLLHDKTVMGRQRGSVTLSADVDFSVRRAGVSIDAGRPTGKQVFATIVQPRVMLPAQPSYPERVAIIVMVGIGL